MENEKSQCGGMGFVMKTYFGKLGLGEQRPISELANEAPLAIVIDSEHEYVGHRKSRSL